MTARFNESMNWQESQKQKVLQRQRRKNSSCSWQEFLAAVRKNLKGQLNNIDILEHDGRIVNLGEKYDNGSKKGN